MQTDQGIKNFTAEEADLLAGKDPDYATRDLFNSIQNGQFVSIIVLRHKSVNFLFYAMGNICHLFDDNSFVICLMSVYLSSVVVFT